MDHLNSNVTNLLNGNVQTIVASNTVDFSVSNENIKNNLTRLLARDYRDVVVYPFGSRDIGVGTYESDLDLYVDVDKSYYESGLEKTARIEQVLSNVARMLNQSNQWKDINVIRNARVPIIKAYNTVDHVNCDISFSDGIGHKNSMFIKYCCTVYPTFKDMIIYLKIWLKEVDLSNHINNYTLTLLILYYLQSINYIPSVEKIQAEVHGTEDIGFWNVKIPKPTARHLLPDVKQHVKRFFQFFIDQKFYGNTIYSTYIGSIATRGGGVDVRGSFDRYRNFIKKYPNESYQFAEMNVHGPFNIAENPAKQVSKNAVETFLKLAKASI